jgi:hypothetical protein
LKTFVGNRVAEIQQSTTPDQWRFVEGKENPADVVSRGKSVNELCESDWWKGPEWLLCEPLPEFVCREPTDREEHESRREKKKEILQSVALISQSGISYFFQTERSDHQRFLRVTAWV